MGSLQSYAGLLSKQSKIDDGNLRTLLSLVFEEEFRKVLDATKLLQNVGIIKEDGTVNYCLVMEILTYVVNNEYLKNLIIKFVQIVSKRMSKSNWSVSS